jgi:Domain of unknown function (DUF4352)
MPKDALGRRGYGGRILYGELASVRGIVDLTSQEALDSAEAFLRGLGYDPVQRTDTTLNVQRSQPGQGDGQNTPNLTVEALPQQEGGVQVVVRGNDQAGVQEQQAAWTEWSESLPKISEAQTAPQETRQPDTETQEVPLPPPPAVETQNLPPAPQPSPSYAPPPTATQRSGMGGGMKLALVGCIGLILLGLLTVGGCFALVATVEPPTNSESGSSNSNGKQKSGSSKGEQSAVPIGESITVGDVTWRVTNATQTNRLSQRDVPKDFAKSKQGSFVVVDFDFTNNGSDPVTLDNASLALIDSEGRESNPDPDQFFYIPNDKQIFLDNINPGVTRQGQTVFEVAPGASGFRLQAGDTDVWSDENGYVDLGF